MKSGLASGDQCGAGRGHRDHSLHHGVETAHIRVAAGRGEGVGVGGARRRHGAGVGEGGGGHGVRATLCPRPRHGVAHLDGGGSLVAHGARPVEVVGGCQGGLGAQRKGDKQTQEGEHGKSGAGRVESSLKTGRRLEQIVSEGGSGLHSCTKP